MRAPSSPIYALALIFLLHGTVKGVNLCGSDKIAENHVVLNESFAVHNNDITLFTSKTKVSRNMTCAWQIAAPLGYSVVLGIIPRLYSEEVERPKINVFDGNSSSDVLLWDSSKTARHRQLVFHLFSSGEHMRVVLKTGNYSESSLSGIDASVYAFVLPTAIDCTNGQVINLNASSAVAKFTSPYYPTGYPLNVSCIWRIRAPPGKLIRLQLENPAVENKDIQVYDERELNENLLWEYNSAMLFLRPYVIFSYTPLMLVKFRGGSLPRSSVLKGFQMEYSVVEPEGGKPANPEKTLKAREKINKLDPLLVPIDPLPKWPPLISIFFKPRQNDPEILKSMLHSEAVEKSRCFTKSRTFGFNASSDSIATPGFPGDVPKQAMTCVWSLNAPVGHIIRLNLDTINLDTDSSICPGLSIKFLSVYYTRRYDYIYDTCTNLQSNTITSNGRRMQVMYTQPANNGWKSVGIIAKYSAIPLVTTGSCAANQPGIINLKGEAGTFHSPNYPKKHPGNMDCTWNITVNAGQVIQLLLQNNLDSDCNKTEFQIYDGPTKSSPLITKLCSFYSKMLYSSSNHLLVKFVGKISSDGFLATYISRKMAPKPYACSSRQSVLRNKTKGMLASWGFPLSYPNNAFCVWYISVPSQYIVNFTLIFLDVQPDHLCSKDYLLLLEGVGYGGLSDGEEIGKLCGKNLTQASFQSSSEYMIVKFRSDSMEMYPGFEAKFEAVYKPPEERRKDKSKVSTLTIVLIVVFCVLGVIGLAILIVWIIKYRYHCCADRGEGNFDMVKMEDTDDVKI